MVDAKEFADSYLVKTNDDLPVYLFAALFMLMILLSVIVLYTTRLKEYLSMVDMIPGARHNPWQSIFVPLLPVIRNKQADMNVTFFQTLCAYTKLYGESGVWRYWAFFRPIVIVCKPETVEEILSSNIIIDKSAEYNFMRPWLKTGLVVSGGAKWKSRRKLLTSAFHFRVLEVFLPVIEEQSLILIEKLKDLNGKGTDIVPLVTLCTLDIICETAMGKYIGAQKNNDSPYLNGLHVVCETIFARIVRPWLWYNKTFYWSKRGKKFNKCVKAMSDFVQQVILERKTEMLQDKNLNKLEEIANTADEGYYGAKKRQAFLDLLLYHHIRDNSLSLEDIEEEVDSFMFAGHDTTAVGISWMLYLLGLYPEVQQKAYEEIYGIFGDDTERNVTLEDVKELKYMECVLKETQRIYPSVPFVARKIREETLVAGYRVPKHSTVLVFSYMMHQNAKYYPDPETFNPERFRPENCNGRHPFSYVPFSAGPRNCIGQKFAFMEEKLIVANILRHFVVKSLDHRDKIHFTMEMVCRSKHGLRLSFTPRIPGSNCKIRAEGLAH